MTSCSPFLSANLSAFASVSNRMTFKTQYCDTFLFICTLFFFKLEALEIFILVLSGQHSCLRSFYTRVGCLLEKYRDTRKRGCLVQAVYLSSSVIRVYFYVEGANPDTHAAVGLHKISEKY